jgi:catechol 2,3-dioxygenase-like lactoylglutathione lyase family enzyme
MIRTRGLTHISLAVRDIERSAAFYGHVFGARDIDRAVAEVERAGGKLLRRGEFRLGMPYAVVADPDGCEVEICYE